MEFLSIPFVVCMTATFLLYYLRSSSRRWQHCVLLLASCVFIGYYHLTYLWVVLGVTVFTYFAGKTIRKHIDDKGGAVLLWGSVIVLAGFWLIERYVSSAFPIGMSFYTFQALAYLIDIYWEEEEPENDFFDFLLYMLMFMKFLSGPIERGVDMLPQLKEAKAFDYDRVVRGLKLVAWGILLKLVIADRIAPSMDMVLDNVRSSSGMQLLVATMVYPIQLYADFAGYTAMAIGFGRMLGFSFHPNFNRPFVSQTTGELWRRWHMTLSYWVRDYVFVPLNASLRGWDKWGTYVSLLVTFVAIGVWHGAGLTFACYGLFQGLVIIYETAAKKQRDRLREIIGAKVWKAIMIVRTYLLFALSLLFFRVARVDDVFYTYRHMFDGFASSAKELRLGMRDYDWIVFGIAVVIMLLLEYANNRRSLILWTERLNAPVRWVVYLGIVFCIFIFGSFGVENFIYIQF